MLAEKLSSLGSACCEREQSCVATFNLISRNDTKVYLGVFILLLFRHLPGIAGKPLHGPVLNHHQAQRRAAVREVSLLFVAILAYWERKPSSAWEPALL